MRVSIIESKTTSVKNESKSMSKSKRGSVG
jgi:hypothetical protein